MARLFANSSTTDKVALGSPAALDDLPVNNDYTLIVCVGRRSGNDGVMSLYGKSGDLTTRGITFFVDAPQTPFATQGHLRACVGTNGSPYVRASGQNDEITDTMRLDVHEIVACQFNTGFGTGSGLKFYRAAVDTWITEVAAYTNEATGSGTIGADASDDANFGFSQTLNEPFTGDLGFCLVYARDTTEYSIADIRRIQSGIWSYLYAVQTGGSTSRAVTIWQSVTGYKLLGYLSSGGTFTDHSGNSITGTLTGTSAGTDDPDWFVPTDFDDDGESLYSPDLREQTDYRYTSSHARKSFTTTATGGTVLFTRTLADPYDDETVIGLIVNDIYTDTLINSGAVGLHRDTFAGLSGSSKTVTFQNGLRGTSGTRPYEGTFLIAVKFNAAATEVASTARTKALVNIGDSVVEGFFLNPAQEDAPLQQLRLLGYSPTYDGVISHGAGGLSLYDIAGDSTKRSAYATILTSGNPKRILIQLGANDQISGAGEWDVAGFETGLDAFCDAILAVGGFTGDITLATVTDWGAGLGGANANGDTIEDFRQAIRDVVTSQATSRVALCELAGGLLTPATDLADGVHLNILGANKLRPRYQDFTADLDYDATVTGTITASVSEADIRSGGKTIVITLGGTRWVA